MFNAEIICGQKKISFSQSNQKSSASLLIPMDYSNCTHLTTFDSNPLNNSVVEAHSRRCKIETKQLNKDWKHRCNTLCNHFLFNSHAMGKEKEDGTCLFLFFFQNKMLNGYIRFAFVYVLCFALWKLFGHLRVTEIL
ncbi:CLUMA_CG012257, isoform A [Clunio marinus]|uniref:CLUMA_CG012257, isoform A n=1 Tax=Clunio marinus TaxID=568069 RepID=A0A1J1IGN9_9DIPT|nr:CLUMA_CG012257, isoform A [Clunio marinus]